MAKSPPNTESSTKTSEWDNVVDETGNDKLAAEWQDMLESVSEQSGLEFPQASDDSAQLTNETPVGGDSPLLSQTEIDSLLGISPKDEVSEHGLRMLLNSGHVTQERMPVLEVVYERFVRMTSSSLRHFTAENVDVNMDSVSTVRFGDYLNQIPLPAMVTIFRAEEWDNFGLVTIDGQLVYSVIDTLLGGRRARQIRIEGRAYTTIETHLIERMVNLLLEDLSVAFDPISPVSFRYERTETNPRFASIALPTNAAMVAKFYVDIEDRGGVFEIVLPYATLEPVRAQLTQLFLGENYGGGEDAWTTHFNRSLRASDIGVEAVLDEVTVPLGKIMDLHEGSTLEMRAGTDPQIRIRSGPVDLFLGRAGEFRNRVAVQLTRAARRRK